MSLKAVKVYLIQLLVLVFLTACSSGSSDDSSGNTTTGNSARISLAVLDNASNQVTKIAVGDSVTLRARLTNTNGLAISGHEISFTASTGTVSAASRLTNSNGQAEVTFDSSGLTPSVITITATTTYNGEELSITSQFEIEPGVSPTLALSMERNGAATNRINEGEQAQVKVRVTSSNNTPITDTLVTFSAGLGTLTPETALTDSNGDASVTLTTAAGDTGAAEITATVTIDGQDTSNTFSYAVEALESAVLSLSVQNQSNNEVTSITEGNVLSIHANLVSSSGVAIPQQAINFTATAGTFSASSRLTGSSGLATVSYDSTNLPAGVVTVTATTTYNNRDLSVTQQFEVLQALGESTTPNLAITFKKDGTSVNRIQADESAQIGVVLTSESGNPIANTIVNFTADLGTLTASSALTNNDGVAEVTINGTAGQLGAGLATASTTVNNINITDSLPYEVVDSDVVLNTSLKLGYLDDQGNFQSGIRSRLTNSNAESTISAGGTLGLELGIFDQDDAIYTPPLTVTFTSTCVSGSNATIDASVTTINGLATTTFEDISCATGFGNEDTIVATVSVNSTDLTATHDINIQAETLGSIEFVSATPESIVIKGTGGQGKQETSTLTFSVKGELGNALAQQTVNFELNTNVGGLALASSSGVTNSEGLVSAKVISGTVPTAVRVTASIAVSGGETITTQSDLLSVNTGLPDQNSITIALSERNPEARNIIGQEVTATVYMADSFNNPVPDGTTVNFTTEGGAIEPSCNTTSGSCSVTWRSTEPFQDNHRVTILATADGHESFVDVNGNNLFDNNDGPARSSSVVSSGSGREGNANTGFIDMSEAWLDANENNNYDSGEKFIDKDGNLAFNARDGRFNGPQCEGSLCSANNSIDVRKSIVMITASSSARYRVSNNVGGTVYASNHAAVSNLDITIPRGSSVSLNIELSDTASQTLPVGTTITIAAEGATLVGADSITIPNTIGTSDPNGYGGLDFDIRLLNELDEADTGALNVTVTSPSGVTTQASMVVVLQ